MRASPVREVPGSSILYLVEFFLSVICPLTSVPVNNVKLNSFLLFIVFCALEVLYCMTLMDFDSLDFHNDSTLKSHVFLDALFSALQPPQSASHICILLEMSFVVQGLLKHLLKELMVLICASSVNLENVQIDIGVCFGHSFC